MCHTCFCMRDIHKLFCRVSAKSATQDEDEDAEEDGPNTAARERKRTA
eukprot:IDg12855t1